MIALLPLSCVSLLGIEEGRPEPTPDGSGDGDMGRGCPTALGDGDGSSGDGDGSSGDGDGSSGDGDGDGDGSPGDGDGDGDGSPNTCSDLELTEGETDIDCGGNCSPCGNGLNCGDDEDCRSDLCENGQCRSATIDSCWDGILSASEEGADCGGLCPECNRLDLCEEPQGNKPNLREISWAVRIDTFDWEGPEIQSDVNETTETNEFEGSWAAYPPKGGSFTPAGDDWDWDEDPCVEAGDRQMHLIGSGLEELTYLETKLREYDASYDASEFDGIIFWGRSTQGDMISLGLLDETASDRGDPWNGTEVTLNTRWTLYKIPFDPSLDLSALVSFHFSIFPNDETDIWLDDLGFYVDE